MNEKFFNLPQQRRNAIIDAALNVFAKYDYKKASTEEIASRAGISKALLFHYFENKKGLYLYVYEYSVETLVRSMSDSHDYSESDFFKIITNAQMCKLRIRSEHPDLMRFLISAYYEESPQVKSELSVNFNSIIADSSKRFLERADSGKFKDGISAEAVLNIVLWMSDGYMRSRDKEGIGDLEALNSEYLSYIDLLKSQFYRPEFL